MIDSNVVPLELINSDIEALTFEETKTKKIFFEGSCTPETCSFLLKKTSSWRGPGPLEKGKLSLGSFITECFNV